MKKFTDLKFREHPPPNLPGWLLAHPGRLWTKRAKATFHGWTVTFICGPGAFPEWTEGLYRADFTGPARSVRLHSIQGDRHMMQQLLERMRAVSSPGFWK